MSIKSEIENFASNSIPILKKRGRKSKKDIEMALKLKQNLVNNIDQHNETQNNETQNNETQNNDTQHNDTQNNDTQNNINILIEDTNDNLFNNQIIEENIYEEDEKNNIISNENDPKIIKKRGRKPKGGKIIQQVLNLSNNKESKPNVILHLKCFFKDLQTNTLLNNDFESFNFTNKNQLTYEIIKEKTSFDKTFINDENITNIQKNSDYYDEYNDDDKSNKLNDIKEIWKKLKTLEHNLHINNICEKKSACFWCTHDFDNPPIYIPKHYIKDSYHVYGCFCSPECATAFLMEENIDMSIKFERYHLMNHIYSKIYNYNKNIKPAPNPYYMLDKYYGNLSIQEYRSLLRNERLFLVVDKPLTRILPELHEENDDFIINNKIIPSNTYQIKKKLQKKQNKSNILSERFGINQI
jgi:hypothetical protein